jgi:hypothetical protein
VHRLASSVKTARREEYVSTESVDIERKRELAYRLWEERGRPVGRAEEDWFEAERRLQSGDHDAESKAVDESIRESFPASDPPSPAVPDKKPMASERRRRRGASVD